MPSLRYNKKLLVLLLVSVLLWLYLIPEPYQFHNFSIYFYNKESIKCYRYEGETLPDISSVNVTKGKSIFFHETSCNSYINGKVVLTSRQACAVESAALLNPHLDIYLLFTSPGIFKFEETESDRFLQALLSYENIRINHLNYGNYLAGTPLEHLYSDGKIESSQYAMSHASDVLRYITLWKYGGIYLDLDVVVIKDFKDLPPNFSGCESIENVAAGIMGFEFNNSSSYGHSLVEECVMDLKENFSGSIWGHNGPGVITRLVKKHCNVTKIKNAMNKECSGFKVFPPEVFYAVPWQSWKQFFLEEKLEKVQKASNDSFIIHVWNKHSISTQLPLNSKSAYAIYAKKNCPKVFSQCDNYF